tara:strand:- start:9856 stop:11505 length:1650 start_codon:yes stop_codon:yes gene_type:complete
MKNLWIIACSFFLVTASWAAEKTVDSKIVGVTVYPVGAMINREAKVSISPGRQHIILDNLTHFVDPNTIQVGGIGDFEILSVKFENFYPYAKSKPLRVTLLEDSLKMYRDKRYLIEAENTALKEEKQLILANKKLAGANASLTVTQLDAMAKYYRSRFSDIAKMELKNTNIRTKLLADEARINGNLAQENSYKFTQVGRIIVEISSERSMQAKFDFSFFTRMAGWMPKYNIKAKSGATNIDVDYHALVNQGTGVNWENVDLLLSTTRPLYGNQKPELHPWYLDFYRAKKYEANRKTAGYGSYDNAMAMEDEAAPEQGVVASSVPNNGAYPMIESVDKASYGSGNQVLNALNTSYVISSKYTILSDNSRKQVFIKQIEIPATFNHYAVPSLEKEAFLTASIVDWAQYDLVPGNATLFYNNTYVGKSYIFTSSSDDTLQVSLGRDRGVILTQEKVKDLCTHNRVGSNVKKNYVYEISVRNTNKEAVTVVIYDRVPVSKRKEIMVSVGEIAGADYDVETGILKWTKTLEAGKSETFRFDYEVKYPKGSQVNL